MTRADRRTTPPARRIVETGPAPAAQPVARTARDRDRHAHFRLARHRRDPPRGRAQDVSHGAAGGPRSRRRELRVRHGQLLGGDGALGLGQEHALEPAGLSRHAELGPVRPAGRGRERPRGRRAQQHSPAAPGLYLPELQPDRAAHGAGEHRAAAVLPRLGRREERGPRGGAGRAGGARRAVEPPARGALGRAAAAGGDRPFAGQRPEDPARRRADGEPRLGHGRSDHEPPA